MNKERRKVEWSLDFDNMRLRAGQFITDMMGGPLEAKKASLHEPLSGAKSCQVKLAFHVGHARVRALETASPNLFEAQLSYVGELEFDASGAAERRILLRQKADIPSDIAAALSRSQDLHWEIGLARGVPLLLELKGGVGDAEIDLSHLLVDAIKMDTGVGRAALTLPGQGKAIQAEIRGGVGLTELRLLAGAFGKLKIKGGVGQMRMRVASGSAIRLQGKTGLGAIDLPASLLPLNDGQANRVWQTANYAAAAQQIDVAFAAGVGRFDLKFAESS